MSDKRQCGQSFVGVAVVGNIPAGQALQLSAQSADAFLGLGADLYAVEQQITRPIQLDGCALGAK